MRPQDCPSILQSEVVVVRGAQPPRARVAPRLLHVASGPSQAGRDHRIEVVVVVVRWRCRRRTLGGGGGATASAQPGRPFERLDSFPERRYCSWLGCHVLVCFVCGVELYFVYEAFLLETPPPPVRRHRQIAASGSKQLHSLHKATGIFRRRYHITHVLGDAVASANFGNNVAPAAF